MIEGLVCSDASEDGSRDIRSLQLTPTNHLNPLSTK